MLNKQSKIDALKLHIDNSVKNANLEKSFLSDEILKLSGMSQRKNRHLLNNLGNFEGLSYLEIGLHKGSTFISTIAGNEDKLLEATGIDNWCEFQESDPITTVKEQFIINFNKYIDIHKTRNRMKLYDIDCFAFDKSFIKNKVNLFFYDGSHDYNAQYKAFVYFNDIFEDIFIALIDDWECASDGPKMGTLDAFTDLRYVPHHMVKLPAGIPDDYHGGVAIALLEKGLTC
jgi:hypothetical protein